jgi:hypothetical protein
MGRTGSQLKIEKSVANLDVERSLNRAVLRKIAYHPRANDRPKHRIHQSRFSVLVHDFNPGPAFAEMTKVPP